MRDAAPVVHAARSPQDSAVRPQRDHRDRGPIMLVGSDRARPDRGGENRRVGLVRTPRV